MPRLQRGNITVELDKEGFLNHMEDWNEEVAELLAENEGVHPMNQTKREIVNYMRQHFLKHHNFPIMRAVCKRINANSDCVADEFVDPMKAWKVAGLPKPPSVFFTSFDGKHYFANPFY